MTTAIDIKNLGKKYIISTQSDGISGYRSMRDGVTDAVRGLFKIKNTLLPKSKSSEFWAVRDVNLTVQQGERVGIVGRNGAGKSTLLKLISRIAHPTTGQISFNGRITSLLEVGTGFHPELTGRENIFLNGAILGMPRIEIRRKFDEIVDFAGVEKFLDTPVKRYSSGMYTRLAFSVAAHLESEILIIDEVLAVGDAQFQKKCLGKMEEVGKKEGRTVLFVSHNMNAVSTFCNRIVWLDKGQVIEDSMDVRATTTRYLQSGIDQAATYWKAGDHSKSLENPYTSPVEFYIGDVQGKPLHEGSIANNQEAYIYITFDAHELDNGVTTGYAIYTEIGELLYWSYQTDSAEDKWPEIKLGNNTFRSRFPSHMLNEGTYQIEWLSSLHFRSFIFEPGKNVPTLQLKIQGGLSESPIWFSRRPGLLAPILPWEKIA